MEYSREIVYLNLNFTQCPICCMHF